MRTIYAVIGLWLLSTPVVFAGNWGEMVWGTDVWGSDGSSNPDCEPHAVYALKTKTLTIPYIEIPIIDFFSGEPTGEVELWTCALKQLAGVTNRFRLLAQSVAPITDGSSTECPATYTGAGKLFIPYVDVPVGVVVGNNKLGDKVETFETILIWDPLGKSFVVDSIRQVD